MRRLANMPSPHESDETVVVIETAPGRVYVKVVGHEPAPDRLERLLRQAIDDWSDAYPQFVIDRTESDTAEEAPRGIHVWYHDNGLRPGSVDPRPRPQPTSLTVEVDGGILRRFPKEYVEAVVEDAVQVWRSDRGRHGTLVVVNPRRIAVVLDGPANRGAVRPVESIYPALEESTRAAVQTWLAAPATRFFVTPLAAIGSLTYEAGPGTVRPVEPTSVRTNMTYDSGPRPEG
jgi:hypothetical protein